MPACFTTSGLVRASRKPYSENWALELQIFWPVTSQSSPSRTAFVDSPARSEPAPGSLNSWQHSRSVRRKARANCSRCWSVPNTLTAAPTRPVVTEMISDDGGTAKARSSSANATEYTLGRPAPPNSSGSEMAP